MASLLPCPPKPPQNPSPKFHCSSRRSFAIGNAAASMVSLAVALALPVISNPIPALSVAEQEVAPPRKPLLPGISSTKSWFQFYGDGFSIRVPPQFEDIMEPEVVKWILFSLLWFSGIFLILMLDDEISYESVISWRSFLFCWWFNLLLIIRVVNWLWI